ncbi:hypothetical protein PLCT1_01056 [Planctomycetaceae bacterium]|nr:hypothetical protein PLCT1_01056 [Planctomycetaceae bacterium]
MSVHSENLGFLLMVLGAVLVMEGIPYVGFPKAVKQWAHWMHSLPEKKMRAIGFAIMAVGIVLLFAIRDILG